MTYQSNADHGKKRASAKEAPLFREVFTLTAEDATFSIVAVSGSRDLPKVSALRLEQYLNPCNPICSG
jgi:hypothetical protein